MSDDPNDVKPTITVVAAGGMVTVADTASYAIPPDPLTVRVVRLVAPTHYPYTDEGKSSTVNYEILKILRGELVQKEIGLVNYARDVMDMLLAIEVDGYKLFQLIDLGRQAVRAGLVAP